MQITCWNSKVNNNFLSLSAFIFLYMVHVDKTSSSKGFQKVILRKIAIHVVEAGNNVMISLYSSIKKYVSSIINNVFESCR